MNLSVTPRRKRRRFTFEQQQQWVKLYSRSGLTQRDFATKHGLGFSTLQRWLVRYPTRLPALAPRAPIFAELKLPPVSGACRWAAEVVKPNGLTVRLAPDAPISLIQQLVGTC